MQADTQFPVPTRSTTLSPLYSSLLESDPDLAEIVELFVGELPRRIEGLRQALDAGDLKQLGVLAHQIKGAAGSHGFAAVTPVAARLETAAKSAEPEDLVREALEELVAICQRLR